MHDDRRFHDTRDAVELSLGGAFAKVDDALQQLDRLASLVDDRAEVDGLRGAIEFVAYAIDGLAVAVGHIARRRESPMTPLGRPPMSSACTPRRGPRGPWPTSGR
jgi:hypothetical protein